MLQHRLWSDTDNDDIALEYVPLVCCARRTLHRLISSGVTPNQMWSRVATSLADSCKDRALGPLAIAGSLPPNQSTEMNKALALCQVPFGVVAI
ncbi:hypothetical protein LCGC14_2169730 [marine sediment metagenome]|uniref:Uncharacterized protein n=1 Tax=marine sediment metagenome TaxID=412755 RepID=A0A0F9G335_9ZZZZ